MLSKADFRLQGIHNFFFKRQILCRSSAMRRLPSVRRGINGEWLQHSAQKQKQRAVIAHFQMAVANAFDKKFRTEIFVCG